MAVRDFSKAEAAARAAGLPRDSYSVVHLDLASLDSVRAFVDAFRASGRRLDALVANAAVYLPTAKEPRFTADGFELSVGTNHLGHFLLCRLLLEDLERAPAANRGSARPRLVIVGSITGNTNTLAGNVPPKADLGDLRGLAAGIGPGTSAMMDGACGGEASFSFFFLLDSFQAFFLSLSFSIRPPPSLFVPIAHLFPSTTHHPPPKPRNQPNRSKTGGEFDGAKAYKDSKVCNMLTMRELHRRFSGDGKVTFASLYPGCIAETGLFREHYPVFRTLFPAFQKYVTKGYVSEEEAGRRLAQVVADPSAEFDKSGVYWSWSNESGSFENEVSDEVADGGKGKKLWELSEKLVGLA